MTENGEREEGARLSEQRSSSRWMRVAAVVAGIGAVGAAIPAGSLYDLMPVMLGLAVLWFVYPLVAAARRGDAERVENLLAARRESLMLQILNFLGRLAIGVVALVAGLYVIPLAAFAYIAVTGTDVESDPGLLAALAFFGGGALAVFTAPFCAGLCDGVDGSGTATRTARALRRLAAGPRWAGRCVMARLSPVVERPLMAVLVAAIAVNSAILVVALYVTQVPIGLGEAFEEFRHYGLDTADVGLGAAMGFLILTPILDKLRGRVRSVEGACTYLFLEFMALAALWAAVTVQLTEHVGVWEIGPGIVAGALFAAAFAILLDLSGAVAAGMLGLTKRRREPPRFVPRGPAGSAFAAGRALGAYLADGGRIRVLLSKAFKAPTARRSSAADLVELRDVLRALGRSWTGRWYLACLAAPPVSSGMMLSGVAPEGAMLVAWLVLAAMSLWGLIVLGAVLAAIGRHRADLA